MLLLYFLKVKKIFLLLVLAVLIFMAAWAFSSCGEQGLLSRCGAQGPPCGGFSCGSWTLARWFSHCNEQAWLFRGTQILPRPGLKPVSPTLEDGFLTAGLAGKALILILETRFSCSSEGSCSLSNT